MSNSKYYKAEILPCEKHWYCTIRDLFLPRLIRIVLCVVRHLPILVGIQSGRQVGQVRHFGDDVECRRCCCCWRWINNLLTLDSSCAWLHSQRQSHFSTSFSLTDELFFQIPFLIPQVHEQRKKAVARVTSVKNHSLSNKDANNSSCCSAVNYYWDCSARKLPYYWASEPALKNAMILLKSRNLSSNLPNFCRKSR